MKLQEYIQDKKIMYIALIVMPFPLMMMSAVPLFALHFILEGINQGTGSVVVFVIKVLANAFSLLVGIAFILIPVWIILLLREFKKQDHTAPIDKK